MSHAIDFYKGKCRRFVNGSTLYQDGRVVGLEQEILPLVLAINRHPHAYTECSCKGHFGAFVPTKVELVVFNDQLALARNRTMSFTEAYPDIDVGITEFFYDRGDIRLVISDRSEGRELYQRLRDWVYKKRERVHIKPNEASESERGICVEFSPDISIWIIDRNSYPVYKVRNYSFDQVLEINTGRIKSIEELQLFFEQ